jgi:hypothetical protein
MAGILLARRGRIIVPVAASPLGITGRALLVVTWGVGVVGELRISDIPAGPGGGRRVEVMWQDGPTRRVAVAEVASPSDERDGERVRWYLEDYAAFSSCAGMDIGLVVDLADDGNAPYAFTEP